MCSVADLLGAPGMGAYGIKVQRPVEANRIGEGHVRNVLQQLGVSDPVIQAVLGQLTGDSATYFTPAKWAPGGENYYVVMRNGKPEFWKIGDRSLYDLVTKQQGGFRAIRQAIAASNPYLRRRGQDGRGAGPRRPGRRRGAVRAVPDGRVALPRLRLLQADGNAPVGRRLQAPHLLSPLVQVRLRPGAGEAVHGLLDEAA